MRRILIGLLILLASSGMATAQSSIAVAIDQTTRADWDALASSFTATTQAQVSFFEHPRGQLYQQVIALALSRSPSAQFIMVPNEWGTILSRYLVDLSEYENRLHQEGIDLITSRGQPIGVPIPFSNTCFLGVMAWPSDVDLGVRFLIAAASGSVEAAAPTAVAPMGVISTAAVQKGSAAEHNPKLDGALEALFAAAESVMGPVVGQALAALPSAARTAVERVASVFGVPYSASTSTVTVVLESRPGRSTSSNVAALSALGIGRGSIEASSSLIKVEVPLAQLSSLASQLGGIGFIRPPYTPHPLGTPTQGTAAIGADAYHSAGIRGNGVKVAVIDMGFSGLSQAQARGDLPSSAVQQDLTGTGLTTGITHGTAVAEIIYDIAPKAELHLIKIADEVELDLAVTYCLDHGIDIINHSLGWYNTNFYDGTGAIADIAQRAIDGGIVWINAAGNEAESHWEGTFTDGNSDEWNDQSITLYAASGAQIVLYLTWNEWPQSSTDYDLYLYDSTSNLVASSTKHQTGTEEPTESLQIMAPHSGTYTIRIRGAGGMRPLELFSLYQNVSPAVASSSILAPANVEDVVTVGAVSHASYTTGPLEPYSSRGPTNAGLTKPDLCAPDNVSTGTAPYTTFPGTSGAAPHAAAAAALLLSQEPSLSESALRSRLLTNTIAMGSANLYGDGRLFLQPPVAPNQAPNASFSLSPSSPTPGVWIQFDGSASSDSDGWIASYSWQFGDGSTGTGASVYHRFSSAGSYTVRLTVTDDDGATDTATRTVTVGTPANQPPSASFSFSPSSPLTGTQVSFSGAGSSDSDGWIASYSWQFGDGTTASGSSTQHAYSAPGTYTVRLTVSDNQGATDTTTRTITVNPPANQAPNASFSFSPSSPSTGTQVSFNGAGSSDSDGWIASYSWQFGDGTTASGSSTQHAYGSPGTYTVRLTVTDNQGASDTATRTVTVNPPANQAPNASFSFSPSLPTPGVWIQFDGSGSSDSDGWIASYSWQFGDGSTGTGVSVYHRYSSAGSYTVRLTATDNQGATDTVTRTVSVGAPANQAPTASFSFSPSSPSSGTQVSFNGAGSSDPDGWIASYSWQFGDGTTASGSSTQHAYNSPGTYTVRLTVSDNQGATDTTTRTVTVTPPANQAPNASFSFSPSSPSTGTQVSFNGAGSSDPDGWIVSYSWQFGDGATASGSSTQHAYSSPGTYTVRLTVTDSQGASDTTTRQLSVQIPSRPDLSIRGIMFSPSSPTIGSQVTVSATIRNVGAGPAGMFRVRLQGAASSTHTFIPQLGPGASQPVSIALPLTASSETFTLTVDDLGQITESNEGNNTASVAVSAATPNPPTANAGGPYSGQVGTAISFNGTGSSGSISGYSWSFGDGGSASGPTPNHTYSSTGTYTVTLTVSGPGGQTTDTAQAVVSAAPRPDLNAELSLPKSVYQVDETIVITITLNRAATVYLCDVSPDGTVLLLYPNKVHSNSQIAAGEHQIPVEGAPYHFRISEPTGTERLYLFAATGPIPGFPTSFTETFATLSDDPTTFRDGILATMQSHFAARDRAFDELQFEVVPAPPSGNRPPVAVINYSPKDPGPNTSIAFAAFDSEDPDGEIIGWHWDFGDGSYGAGDSWRHIYRASGTFVVTLTVTDNDGATDTVSIEIVVD